MRDWKDGYYGEDSDGTGRDVRDHIAHQKEEIRLQREYEKTPEGQCDKFSRQIRRLEKDIEAYRHQRIDSGDPQANDKITNAKFKIEELRVKHDVIWDQIAAKEQAQQDEEWTREVTAARKIEWNALVVGRGWSNSRIERELGFKLGTIKQYLEKYDL